ncbi:MAG: hypothetical protein AB7F89_23940 [Pirellulaceae bacterium]
MILFGLLTAVLAISTFVFYRQSDEASKLAEAAEKGKQDATTRANDSDSRLEFVLHILGINKLPEAEVEQLKQSFGADETMKNVITNYEQHMSTYAAGLPKEEQTYAEVLPKMLMNMRQINVGVIDSQRQATQYKDERDATQKAEKARSDAAIRDLELAQKERDDEKNKYLADRTKLEDEQKTQLASFKKQLGQKDSQMASLNARNDTTLKEMKKTADANASLLEAVKQYQDEPFEVGDGVVTWVNQGARTVWINLGLADGLRRQTMFSVYDQADNGVQRTDPKASIEVTKVLDQHLAEARIAFDGASNPIMRGDVIFSPAWRPGKRIRFALAGVIDIDGDGRSDRNLVRSLLSASGGQIDFEAHDDGKKEGEMTAGIRYLVLGSSPAEGDPTLVNREALAAYSEAQDAADKLGIEKITVDKMLEWVGYRPEVRTPTVGLGKNADSSQFRPTAEEGKNRVSTHQFRPRQPPAKVLKGGPAANK